MESTGTGLRRAEAPRDRRLELPAIRYRQHRWELHGCADGQPGSRPHQQHAHSADRVLRAARDAGGGVLTDGARRTVQEPASPRYGREVRRLAGAVVDSLHAPTRSPAVAQDREPGTYADERRGGLRDHGGGYGRLEEPRADPALRRRARVPRLQRSLTSVCRRPPREVLGVGHLLHPGDVCAVERLLDRYVRHVAFRSRAVPMPPISRTQQDVARAELLDRFVFHLCPTHTLDPDEGLSERM